MGKSVIAFKVIVTPRFHFECIFIGLRNKVDKQTMLPPFPGWQTPKCALPVDEGITVLDDREKYHALQQYDPLQRSILKSAVGTKLLARYIGEPRVYKKTVLLNNSNEMPLL